MKAYITDDNGGILAVNRPAPIPAPDQVLVNVRAAGVNRPDILQRMGHYPPPDGVTDILGLEVAGEIAAVGQNVNDWSVGDRVCALVPGGGYAEYVAAHAGAVLPVPKDMDWAQAAVLPETVFTVYANVFQLGRLQSGETLLVTGANSGIGVTAVQMAKAHGAHVVAMARKPELNSRLKDLGADAVINTTEDIPPCDVILDMLGGDYVNHWCQALNPGGRAVSIAFLAGRSGQVDVMRMMQKQLTFTGSTLRGRPDDAKAALASAIHKRVWTWVETGQVRPPIAARFSLADAIAAHTVLETGGHVGKVVLTVG